MKYYGTLEEAKKKWREYCSSFHDCIGHTSVSEDMPRLLSKDDELSGVVWVDSDDDEDELEDSLPTSSQLQSDVR